MFPTNTIFMKSISKWAHGHKWSSRLIIIFLIYPVLNIFGWILGGMISLEGWQFNEGWYYLLAILFILVAANYPRGSKRHTLKNFYFRRKISDSLLATLSFCFIVLSGNRSGYTESIVAPVFATVKNLSAATTEKPSVKKEKKALKKLFKKLLHKYRKASDGEKVLLIILTIVVALALIYLLAALSCSIACGGAEGLAYVVFTLGLGGIVFGVVRVIRSISRKSRKKKEAEMRGS